VLIDVLLDWLSISAVGQFFDGSHIAILDQFTCYASQAPAVILEGCDFHAQGMGKWLFLSAAAIFISRNFKIHMRLE